MKQQSPIMLSRFQSITQSPAHQISIGGYLSLRDYDAQLGEAMAMAMAMVKALIPANIRIA